MDSDKTKNCALFVQTEFAVQMFFSCITSAYSIKAYLTQYNSIYKITPNYMLIIFLY